MTPRPLILLVDDDEAVLDFFGAKLRSEYELLAAASADAALAMARERRPDLVLCDIELPGMDGGDLSATLFGDPATTDIPFAFLTSLVSPEELKAQGHQLAGRAAISKQAPVPEILARIRALLP